MAEGYDARDFWSKRLGRNFNLRGVGQWEYDDAYNRWLYRAKAHALEPALSGLSGRAFDIGSGVGWVVEQLVQRGFTVDGCDITDQAVYHLAARYPASTFTRLAIGTDPVPVEDDTYDVATMMDVAYHITDDDLWSSAVGEVARILVPRGKLVFTDRLGNKPESAGAHVRFRSADQWLRVAADHGLQMLDQGVLYRRLSRPRNMRHWGRLPDGLRGQVEYRLDRLGVGAPTLRWGVLLKVDQD